jgi:hypothetical protein
MLQLYRLFAQEITGKPLNNCKDPENSQRFWKFLFTQLMQQ